MKRTFLVTSLALAAVTASLTPSLAAPATPMPAPSTASASASASVATRAATFLAAVRSKTIDRSQLTRAFSAELTPEVVATFAGAISGLGEPTSIAPRSKVVVDGVTTYDFTVGFASGQIVLVMGIDDATDKIARFYLKRA